MEKEIEQLKLEVSILKYQIAVIMWKQNYSLRTDYPPCPLPQDFGLDSTTISNTFTFTGVYN